jgi:phenylpropionate dioxygenase-like ring-hydroxylating dioxygenase large terminal subunit
MRIIRRVMIMPDATIDRCGFDIGTGPLCPDSEIMRTGRVELTAYYDQERYNREREVFGRVWLNVAETGEIPSAGDWIVRPVKIRSASIIIVRGKDTKIRAFHNICSHRGMKLLWDNKGHGGKFSCPYHAWIYDAQGSLVNIPDEGCFSHTNKKESGLTPVSCDTWAGFIFINLDPAPAQGLAEYLAPLADYLQEPPLAAYTQAARIGGAIRANWKLCIEAQSEAYHVRALHSRTVSKMLSSAENPYIHPLAWEALGAHGMKSEPRNPRYELASGALVQAFAFASVGHLTDAKRVDQVGATIASHAAFNPARSNDWGNDQFVIYPHFIFHVSHGGWWLHRFWPVTSDWTDWESVYHFAPATGLRSRFALEYSLAFNRDTLLEDNMALVQQQEVMASGAKSYAQFGSQEIQCKHIAAVHCTIAADAATAVRE